MKIDTRQIEFDRTELASTSLKISPTNDIQDKVNVLIFTSTKRKIDKRRVFTTTDEIIEKYIFTKFHSKVLYLTTFHCTFSCRKY